jgi:6-pyruvoyltetrahydropterin/6-carboxytetrahydropterin synthase
VLADYDHKHLNEVATFDKENPSSENLARVIFKKMKKKIKALSKVTVYESATACASYRETA